MTREVKGVLDTEVTERDPEGTERKIVLVLLLLLVLGRQKGLMESDAYRLLVRCSPVLRDEAGWWKFC
ncbi:MAG: hypothetical protein SynsKO_11790 [Synoicihabitans sp.]